MVSRQWSVVLAVLIISAAFPRLASGQDGKPAPAPAKALSSTHLEELKKWMKEDAKYLKWHKQYQATGLAA